MKLLRASVFLLLPTCAFGAYQYYYGPDPLTSINTTDGVKME